MWNCWSDKYFVNIMEMCICLIRSHWRVSDWSTSLTYIQDPNLFITVPLDACIFNGTRSSAVTVFSTKSHIFLWSSIGYHQTTVAVMLCSVGTQCKLNKDKVNKKHKWTELNSVNTLRPRQNGRHFRNWICVNLIKISLKFVPKGQINNIPALVQIMAYIYIYIYICMNELSHQDQSIQKPDYIGQQEITWGSQISKSGNLKFTIVFTCIRLDMQPLKLQRAIRLWWQGCPSGHKILHYVVKPCTSYYNTGQQ